MKKGVFGRKFSRERNSRVALFRGLIRALVLSGKIATTREKAKAIVGDVDKLVRLAKEGTLAANRKIFSELGNDQGSLIILRDKVAPAMGDRVSGFTRITYLPPRRGDNASMARIEWVNKVDLSEQPKSKEEKTKKLPKVKKEVKTTKKLGKKVTKAAKKK